MENIKVERNRSDYQREIERSFTVIYHNLKRIREDNVLQKQKEKCFKTQPTSVKPSAQYRLQRETLQALPRTSVDAKNRKVSFSVDAVVANKQT